MRDDARAIARVHVDSWRGGYRGLIADAVLDALDVDLRERQWTERLGQDGVVVLVAELEGEVKGFAAATTAGFDATVPEGSATIAALHVAPEAWGRGLGGALLDAALDELRVRGVERVSLWVIEGNARAWGLYEGRGFRPDGSVERDDDRGADEHRMVRDLSE